MTNTPHKHPIGWIDDLRVLATVSVIMLHAASGYLYDSTHGVAWWAGNIYDGAVRFCVPVFVMISGALLLHDTDPWPQFYKKRFLRLLPPFLFWSLVYIAYSWYIMSRDGKVMAPAETLSWALTQLRDGSAYHLWYMYMILGLYLFIPLMRLFLKALGRTGISIVLCLWSASLFITLVQQHFFSEYKGYAMFAGYLVLGYYLRECKLPDSIRTNAIAVFMIVAGTFATIYGTHVLTVRNGEYNGTYYEYLSPNVMLTSAGLFLLFRQASVKIANPYLARIKTGISRYSFGIYLAHLLILDLLSHFPHQFHALIQVPFQTIACLIISTGIIFLFHKLPYGKYISG